MVLKHSLTPYTKIKLNMDEGCKCETNSIKTLQENTANNNTLLELGHSNFGQITSATKARETRAKMDRWDFIKMSSFRTAKETLSKTQRQRPDWEKIRAHDLSHKRPASKISEELLQLHSKETNHPIQKWAQDRKRKVTQEDIDVHGQKHTRPLSASLAASEIQIKTTMRSHLTLVRILRR